MQTSEKLSANESPCEIDEYDKVVVLTKTTAIDEVHICLLFVLINPLKCFLQVPKLLVLRLLLQQAMDVVLVILSLDEHIKCSVNFDDILIAAIWITDQLLSNGRILQSAQIVVLLRHELISSSQVVFILLHNYASFYLISIDQILNQWMFGRCFLIGLRDFLKGL
jgi:hypothetical protein